VTGQKWYGMRTPRAVRPIEFEYIIVGSVLGHHHIYDMTEQQFIKLIMKKSRGHMNPNKAKEIYHVLMNEAGLEPLYDQQA